MDRGPRLRRLILAIALVAIVALAVITAASALNGASPPRNDDFSAAAVVPPSGLIQGTLVGATAQADEPAVGAGARTSWFVWRAPAAGVAYVLPTARRTAVTIHIYTGRSLGHLHRVDQPAFGASNVLAQFGPFPGQRYYIQISAPQGERYAVRVLQPTPGMPGNATPAAATPLAAAVRAAFLYGPLAGAVLGTTTGLQRGHAVYYSWSAPAGTRGTLRLSLAHVTRGAKLSLNPRSIRAVPGRTYLVAVRGTPAYFSLLATPQRGFRLDTQPPVVRCAGLAGWHRTNVNLICRAQDSGSGLANPRQARFVLSTRVPAGAADPAALTGVVQVCDRAANCVIVGPLRIHVDRSLPTVTCGRPGSPGVQRSVQVICTTSVLANGAPLANPADGSFALHASLPVGRSSSHVSFSGHPPVCNAAGSCAPVPAPAAVAIDRAGPPVSCSPVPRGWVRSATITCSAKSGAVALAGVPGPIRLTTPVATALAPGLMYTNSRAVCDKLGNCTIVGPFAVKVDDQAPLVSCKAPGGWRRGAVARIACLASDTGAGLTGPAHFGLLAKVGAGHQGSVRTGTRQVCDRIGNCTTVGPYSVSLDDAPPQVSCGPVPGGWQHAPVTIPCAVTDLGSGVAPKNQLILLHLSGVPGRRVIRAFPRVRVCDRVGNCTRTPALPRVRLAIPAG